MCTFLTTSEYWADVFRKQSTLLKDLFTKWVRVHHYAHSVSSCSKSREEQRKKHQKVVLWSVALEATSLHSPHTEFLPWTSTKAGGKEEVSLGLPGSLVAACGWNTGKNIGRKRKNYLLWGERIALNATSISITPVCSCTGETAGQDPALVLWPVLVALLSAWAASYHSFFTCSLDRWLFWPAAFALPLISIVYPYCQHLASDFLPWVLLWLARAVRQILYCTSIDLIH